MGRVIGPILTTGVALAASGVVVANPIAVAPRADMQIPAVALSSGSDEMVGMLDPAFLDAIAPEPASVNPFTVIKDLISALAADATYRGTNAIVEAFVAGVAVVTEPELTAAWSPYIPPPADLPVLAVTLLPGADLSSGGATPAPEGPLVLPDPQPFIAETVMPAVYDLVGTLADDVTYVGREAIAAAFAAGAVVAAEPVMIYNTLRALVLGDLKGALNNAVKVVTAPLGPPLMVVDAMRTVVELHLAAMFAGLAPPPVEAQTAPVEQVRAAELPSATGSEQTRAAAPQTRPAEPLSAPGDGPRIPLPAASTSPAGIQADPEIAVEVAQIPEPAADIEAEVAEVADAEVAEIVEAGTVEAGTVDTGTVDAGTVGTEVAAPARRAATAVRDTVTETGERAVGAVRGAAGAVASAVDRAGADDPAGDGS